MNPMRFSHDTRCGGVRPAKSCRQQNVGAGTKNTQWI